MAFFSSFFFDGTSCRTETLKNRFIDKTEWPPSSPDANPLDYFFWDNVKSKVYEGRMGKPFANEYELKAKIQDVWNDCAKDTELIRKAIRQFIPRLEAVLEKRGFSIKTTFG